MNAKKITQIALIAASYASITYMLAPISYGHSIFQIRVSEALTILPFITPLAIPGLFIGCIIANLLGGFGIIDVVFGSLASLISAYLTSKMPTKKLAPLPPVIVNGLIVGGYLSFILNVPVVITIFYVTLGQLIACYGLGYPLLIIIDKKYKYLFKLSQ